MEDEQSVKAKIHNIFRLFKTGGLSGVLIVPCLPNFAHGSVSSSRLSFHWFDLIWEKLRDINWDCAKYQYRFQKSVKFQWIQNSTRTLTREVINNSEGLKPPNLFEMLDGVELDKLKCQKLGSRVYHARYYGYLLALSRRSLNDAWWCDKATEKLEAAEGFRIWMNRRLSFCEEMKGKWKNWNLVGNLLSVLKYYCV